MNRIPDRNAAAPPASRAAQSYDNLSTAVPGLTEALVLKGGERIRGQTLLVDPHDFIEQQTHRRLPLSEFLRDRFAEALHGRGVVPILPGGAEDENTVMVLQVSWRVLGDGRLHLMVRIRESAASGSRPVALASGEVESVEAGLFELDPGFLARHTRRRSSAA